MDNDGWDDGMKGCTCSPVQGTPADALRSMWRCPNLSTLCCIPPGTPTRNASGDVQAPYLRSLLSFLRHEPYGLQVGIRHQTYKVRSALLK